MEDSTEKLFTYVAPEQLRRSVLEVFFTWLIEEPMLPENYKQVSEDFYFLLKFLDEEESRKEKH